MNTPHHKTLALVAAALLLSACGGSDDDTPPPAPTTTVGIFLDAAVDGLDYSVAGGSAASTSGGGHFSCQAGQTLSFSAGGVVFGSAPCAATITPLTLAGLSATSSDVKADAVVNRLLALQSLDEDRDPSNGIQLAAAVKTALTGKTLNFGASAADFNTAFNATLAALPAPYNGRVVDDARRVLAREHFENTLGAALGTPVPEASTQANALGEWHLLWPTGMAVLLNVLASLWARHFQPRVGFGASFSHSWLDTSGSMADLALGDGRK